MFPNNPKYVFFLFGGLVVQSSQILVHPPKSGEAINWNMNWLNGDVHSILSRKLAIPVSEPPLLALLVANKPKHGDGSPEMGVLFVASVPIHQFPRLKMLQCHFTSSPTFK